MPDDLQGVSANFSPGVGWTVAFDEELATRYAIKSFLADYSVEPPSVSNESFDFEKKFLGIVNNDRYMRLEDWIEKKTGGGGGLHSEEFILQMDIEGAEFGVLIDTPSAVLRRFRIMIIEFHAMERMFAKHTLGILDGILDKVLRDFCVVHIHPINHCSSVKVGNVEIPRVIEVTFYRRDRAVFDNAKLSFPHRLDRPSMPEHPDVFLPAIWQNQVRCMERQAMPLSHRCPAARSVCALARGVQGGP